MTGQFFFIFLFLLSMSVAPSQESFSITFSLALIVMLFCVEDKKIYSSITEDTTQSHEGSSYNILLWQPLSTQSLHLTHQRGHQSFHPSISTLGTSKPLDGMLNPSPTSY